MKKKPKNIKKQTFSGGSKKGSDPAPNKALTICFLVTLSGLPKAAWRGVLPFFKKTKKQ